jgi:hypothetical protein
MTDHRDEIDRAIDEALAAAVAGEPRRVTGASVRGAAAEPRRSLIPWWLGVAAVLLVGLTLGLLDRLAVGPPPAMVSGPIGPGIPTKESPQNAPSPSPVAVAEVASGTPTHPTVAHGRGVPRRRVDAGLLAGKPEYAPGYSYEGLPRLTIASLDLPEPLVPGELEAQGLRIPAIEIAPLSVSSLSNEYEH